MKQKILYTALLLFTFWLFAEGIPIYFYERYSTFLSIIGCIIMTVLAVAALISFFPKPAAENSKDDNTGYFIFAVIIFTLFGTGIFFIHHSTARKEREIKNYGKFAVARIIDGNSFKTRRIDNTNIKVVFQFEDGKDCHADIAVSAAEFKQFSLNQDIPVVYSSRYPSVIKIINDDKELEKYTHNVMRNIKLADLLKLYEIKKGRKVFEYLNTISQKWDYKGYTYYNMIKKVSIHIDYPAISYTHNIQEPNLFNEELTALGFTPVEIAGQKAFSNEEFIVLRENKTPINRLGNQYPFPEMATVISIIKYDDNIQETGLFN